MHCQPCKCSTIYSVFQNIVYNSISYSQGKIEMNTTYALKIKTHFPQIYKNYLETVLQPDVVDLAFNDTEFLSKFDDVIRLVYTGKTFGNEYTDAIRTALTNYESFTNRTFNSPDKNLRCFLHIYRYLTQSTYTELAPSDNQYLYEKEDDYFTQLSKLCNETFDNIFVDLKNGNRWWEIDTPTSLRRQLLNDKLIITIPRLQSMCEAYLGKTINLRKELKLKANNISPNKRLVKALDKQMRKHGLTLMFAYVDIINGIRKVVETETPPKDGRYYLLRYVVKTK